MLISLQLKTCRRRFLEDDFPFYPFRLEKFQDREMLAGK